jgi:hypothetical protein
MGMNIDQGMGIHGASFLNPTGTGLGVPMTIKSAINQHKGVMVIRWFC